MCKIIFFDSEEQYTDMNFVGTQSEPEFVIGSRAVANAQKNIKYADDIQESMNKNLHLKEYINDKIRQIQFIYLLYPHDWLSGAKKERKYYSRKDKIFYIDISFPDFDEFCRADEIQAKKIMLEQTLRAIEKYLPKVKEFNYTKFYSDLIELFKEQKLIAD